MEPKSPLASAPDYGRNRGNIPGIVFLLLASLAVGGYGAFIAYKQAAMPAWPTAEATIIEFTPGGEDHGESGWYRNPKVRFEYTVAGARHVGTKLNPSPFNYQDKEQFARETGKLKAGAKVECWYNPGHPAESYVVNAGISAAAVIFLAIGLLILCLLVKALCTPAPKPGGDGDRNAAASSRN